MGGLVSSVFRPLLAYASFVPRGYQDYQRCCRRLMCLLIALSCGSCEVRTLWV